MKPPVTPRNRRAAPKEIKPRRPYARKPKLELTQAGMDQMLNQQLADARNIATNEERQAAIAMLEQTAASLLGPLGVSLQDGRFMGVMTPELILEHVKALSQSAERLRRGDHRRTAP